ncbi:MAG: hypothetical protein HN348_18580, partial [Proteobacteria bacterium]|nr:hypothetical protein [Pseudomonadota bacterium]
MFRCLNLGRIVLALMVAFVSGVAGATDWPDLSQAAPVVGGGQEDAALVVAIEDYAIVDDVPRAKLNANDWYTWMVDTRQVPISNVALLRDNEGTREGILAAARGVASRVKPGGTLWFVFVGHGAPAMDGQDGLLVGWDTQRTARSVYARGATQKEILNLFVSGQQEHTVMVLDACFSGRSRGTGLVEGLQPMIPIYALNDTRATVLTAAKADQFAGPLPNAERPAFSY